MPTTTPFFIEDNAQLNDAIDWMDTFPKEELEKMYAFEKQDTLNRAAASLQAEEHDNTTQAITSMKALKLKNLAELMTGFLSTLEADQQWQIKKSLSAEIHDPAELLERAHRFLSRGSYKNALCDYQQIYQHHYPSLPPLEPVDLILSLRHLGVQKFQEGQTKHAQILFSLVNAAYLFTTNNLDSHLHKTLYSFATLLRRLGCADMANQDYRFAFDNFKLSLSLHSIILAAVQTLNQKINFYLHYGDLTLVQQYVNDRQEIANRYHPQLLYQTILNDLNAILAQWDTLPLSSLHNISKEETAQIAANLNAALASCTQTLYAAIPLHYGASSCTMALSTSRVATHISAAVNQHVDLPIKTVGQKSAGL